MADEDDESRGECAACDAPCVPIENCLSGCFCPANGCFCCMELQDGLGCQTVTLLVLNIVTLIGLGIDWTGDSGLGHRSSGRWVFAEVVFAGMIVLDLVLKIWTFRLLPSFRLFEAAPGAGAGLKKALRWNISLYVFCLAFCMFAMPLITIQTVPNRRSWMRKCGREWTRGARRPAASSQWTRRKDPYLVYGTGRWAIVQF